MNYAEFKALREPLEARQDAASKSLRAIPGISSGPMGLTPDDNYIPATGRYLLQGLEHLWTINGVRFYGYL